MAGGGHGHGHGHGGRAEAGVISQPRQLIRAFGRRDIILQECFGGQVQVTRCTNHASPKAASVRAMAAGP